ncbi:MAG: glycosyltransferase family 92 protein, partial [Loktanella sp.]|nr:glycosyltransferase family 92 protein [Loktanella sp.]
GRHQVNAYKRATRMKEYQGADWVMALDLDEFLVIHCGNHTLPDIIAHMPDFDCAHVNWLHFGHSGHLSPPEGLVTEHFTKCADRSLLANGLEPFKTLFRNEAYSRPGIHVPRGAKLPPEKLKVVNGSGLKKGEFALKNFRCTDPALRRFAQVNHYIVRDASSYILKSAKGSAHQANREIGKKYWKKRNKNTSESFDLATRAEFLKDAMREMDEITGGRLAKLSEVARRRHAMAIRQALTNDWAKDLYDYCVRTA